MYTVPVPESKFRQHVRDKIGEAIYLLGYLIHEAKWETGTLITTQRRIAEQTGFPERTIARWMQTLQEAGEITVRRVRIGSLITIVDYHACARTRRKRLQADAVTGDAEIARDRKRPIVPSADGQCAVRGSTHVPNLADEDAGSGRTNTPQATHQHVDSGISNIKQIMNQIMNQNVLQNSKVKPINSLSSPGNQNAQGRRPGELFDYTEPHDRMVAEAKEVLRGISEEEYARLSRQALEEMASDARSFVRMFVRRDESGEIVPTSEYGKQLMMIRMARQLSRESAAP